MNEPNGKKAIDHFWPRIGTTAEKLFLLFHPTSFHT